METAGFESQVPVLATRLKGEVTCAPFAGVVTVIACAGTMIVTSAKIEPRNCFIDQPHWEMSERAFPLTVAAACATVAKSMLTMAVIAQRTVRTNCRGVLFPIGILLEGIKRSFGEKVMDLRRRRGVTPVESPREVSTSRQN